MKCFLLVWNYNCQQCNVLAVRVLRSTVYNIVEELQRSHMDGNTGKASYKVGQGLYIHT